MHSVGGEENRFAVVAEDAPEYGADYHEGAVGCWKVVFLETVEVIWEIKDSDLRPRRFGLGLISG